MLMRLHTQKWKVMYFKNEKEPNFSCVFVVFVTDGIETHRYKKTGFREYISAYT